MNIKKNKPQTDQIQNGVDQIYHLLDTCKRYLFRRGKFKRETLQ